MPKIPLGSRGPLHGHEFEVIGFARRYIDVDGEEYGWNEYVLFNRAQGFRYLSEYEGHWNDIRTVRGMPQQAQSGGKPAACVPWAHLPACFKPPAPRCDTCWASSHGRCEAATWPPSATTSRRR